MSTAPISILLVEDSPSDAALLQESLNENGAGQFQLTHVENLAEALARLSPGRFDIMLLDLSLADSTLRETFLRERAAAPEPPIVVLTGTMDEIAPGPSGSAECPFPANLTRRPTRVTPRRRQRPGALPDAGALGQTWDRGPWTLDFRSCPTN
jgi:CheY-like chemotaxis protein